MVMAIDSLPLDPRTKLAVAVSYTIILMLTSRLELLVIGLAAVAVVVVALDLFHTWLQMLRLALVMTAIVFAISLLSFGLTTALTTSVRLLAVVTTFFIFFHTTAPEDLANVMVKMGSPYAFAFILSTGMQFVPVIQRRLAQVRDAQRARGIRLEADLASLPNYPALLVPLLISSFQLADELAEAMESRGFGSPHRTFATKFRLGWRDYGLLLLAAISLTSVVCWRGQMA
jgi:energy-coupling factor transport system permease protein